MAPQPCGALNMSDQLRLAPKEMRPHNQGFIAPTNMKWAGVSVPYEAGAWIVSRTLYRKP